MKFIIIRLFFLILLTKLSVGVAGDSLEINKIVEPSISLTSYLAILEDSSQKLTLADVQQESLSSHFKTHFPPQESINLSYTSSAYWLRLVLENTSDRSIEKILAIHHPLLKNVDFYGQLDGKDYQTIHTGYGMPFENRAYHSKIFAFPVQFPAHSQQVIYLRIASPNAIFIVANLWEPMAFQLAERNKYAFQAFYFGIVVTVMLLSLALTLILREFDYVLYVSMIFFTALVCLTNQGLGAEFIWPNVPWLTQMGSLCFGAFTLASHLLFIRRILDTQRLMPRLDPMFKPLIGLNLLIPLLLIVSFAWAKFAIILFGFSAFFVLIVLITGVIKKQKNTFLLSVGFSTLSLGIIARTLHAVTLLPSNFYTINSIQLGSAIELLIFTLFLTDRYYLVQQEKRRTDFILKNTKYKLFDEIKARREAVGHQVSLVKQVNQMQKIESISQLTPGISHDFNNVLSVISGYNELNALVAENCQEKSLKEELLFNSQQISVASDHAIKLIKKLMAYSRQQPLNKEIEVRLTRDVIEETLEMMRPGLTQLIQVYANLDSELTIQIDATNLYQILSNLLVNARDAMKDQVGELNVSLKEISSHELICSSCAQWLDGEFIELCVSDNGPGIEETVIKHIFEAFFTTKAVGEGTGLGLSTVCNMVHEAQGHIIVESKTTEPNRGTAFRLLFPRC